MEKKQEKNHGESLTDTSSKFNIKSLSTLQISDSTGKDLLACFTLHNMYDPSNEGVYYISDYISFIIGYDTYNNL